VLVITGFGSIAAGPVISRANSRGPAMSSIPGGWFRSASGPRGRNETLKLGALALPPD
jgi:hypothetical protein